MAYMYVPGNNAHEEIQLDGVGTYSPRSFRMLNVELR